MVYLFSIILGWTLVSHRTEVPEIIVSPKATYITETDQIKKIIQIYLDLKESLIEEDTEQASRKSAILSKNFRRLRKRYYIEETDELIAHSNAIRLSQDIEEQRRHFARLSELFIPMVRNTQAGENFYVHHCTKALDGDGAYWLSEQAIVRNPYFGHSNLRCGEVVEII